MCMICIFRLIKNLKVKIDFNHSFNIDIKAVITLKLDCHHLLAVYYYRF
jgi:hypothetical protein